MPIDTDTLRKGLELTLDATDLGGPPPRGLGTKYEGKVRDNYLPGDGRRILVTTDRISAFDRVLGTLPFKGQVLNQLAAWWFDQTKDVASNHVLSIPDPNVTIGIDCRPLEVELVVRAYLTGVTSTSIWTHYAKGARTFCGHALPDGLAKNDALPAPILTPSTKAEKGGHDVSVSRDELLAMGRVSAEEFDRASQLALALFRRGQELCAKRGLILVDTKYEMGVDPSGRIVVIDEMHTPDSSRYWFRESYEERRARGEEPESFDKEYVRRWLAAQGWTGDGPMPPIPDEVRIEASRRYVEACETIMGRAFVPDLEDPQVRLRRNLGLTR
ncbi:phosphoribosylaminoimidazolesuccinocarboxamide synthase [Sandaracinus amylolyticus]|uniref:Phosphoribosylaminoimidazole-succinocarboxamide synthase n=1 Tax=Sandaracinus amylolyticus TaxID=927083 RepID=A0A0F6YHV1_9BACT|nr:phosphoribosylaminoimidazolesuccinocarboxamide synthase [Sandaracinus amylolyticus]AKF05528.1 Phosphoribosylaminoimidazole-succinocarboxamide synthase [Sandaracinus amylolyticus]